MKSWLAPGRSYQRPTEKSSKQSLRSRLRSKSRSKKPKMPSHHASRTASRRKARSLKLEPATTMMWRWLATTPKTRMRPWTRMARNEEQGEHSFMLDMFRRRSFGKGGNGYYSRACQLKGYGESCLLHPENSSKPQSLWFLISL